MALLQEFHPLIVNRPCRLLCIDEIDDYVRLNFRFDDGHLRRNRGSRLRIERRIALKDRHPKNVVTRNLLNCDPIYPVCHNRLSTGYGRAVIRAERPRRGH